MTGDNGAAIAFLEQWRPGDPWLLSACDNDREGMETRTFMGGPAAGDLGRWLDRWNGKRNLYFHVNPTTRALNKKAEREDIAALDWLHVDLDPRAGEDLDAERVRILATLQSPPDGIPPATVIIFSGGGYQAFWKLSEPFVIGGDLGLAETAKLWNLELETRFGADRVHNVDRIMRLPGTVNIPNEKKRKAGQVEVVAELVSFDPERVYPLSAFTASTTSTATVAAAPRLDGDDLEKRGLETLARVVIARGLDPDNPDRFKIGKRSDAVFYVCCAMVRAGFSDAEIVAVITDPDWPISEHVLEQKVRNYAARQAERARDAEENEFKTDKNGTPYPIQPNIRLAVRKLGAVLSFNEFSQEMLIEGFEDHGPLLQDETITALWLRTDETHKFRPKKEFFHDVVVDLARRDKFNPVRDYLDGLAWDGEERVDRWLSRYGQATDTPYTRAVASLFMLAAVRRARKPGCKFDEMMVLVSPQGTGKSSALQALCPDPDLFSDDLPMNADSKIVIERIAGRWIVEVAELTGLRAARAEHCKAMLSRQVDRARMAYGRITKVVPRACVFAGSTNTGNFLEDLTGNRRYWPIKVDRFDLDALVRDRDQLWAEAAHREASGESIRLDPNLYEAAKAAQEAHEVENQLTPVLDACLGDVRGKLACATAWEIVNIPTDRRTQDNATRLGKAMIALGFKRMPARIGGTVMKSYVKGSAPHVEIKVIPGNGGRWFISPDCRAPRTRTPHAQEVTASGYTQDFDLTG